MAARTITQPATGSSLASSVVRNQLQLIENEVADPTSIDPGHLHTPAGVSATGTPDATTYWRGDNTWSVPDISFLVQETPSGTVNATNTAFTVLNTPVLVIADGLIRPISASVNDFGGNAVTYSAGTITFNALTPPVQFVVTFYNS